jgi:hypothetical protein
MLARVAVLLSLSIALAMVSCSSDPTRGYSFKPAFDTQVRTISIPIFENPTFYHGLEGDLTDAIVKEIQQRTPWVVVSGAADTSLSGSITEVSMRPLTTSRRTGLVEDMALAVTVRFEWKDLRTNEFLVRRSDFTATESFVPARPSSERLELGQHAVVQELARAVVSELRSGW